MTKWKYSRKEIGKKLGIVEDKKRGVITYPGDIPGLKVAELLFWVVKAPVHGKKVKEQEDEGLKATHEWNLKQDAKNKRLYEEIVGKKVKDGDVFTLYGVPFIAKDGVPKGDVWVYKKDGKKVKIKIGLEPNYTDLLKPTTKKVKEIESLDRTNFVLHKPIDGFESELILDKLNELIDSHNHLLKNK